MKQDNLLRIAICSQGLLYIATAIISSANVSFFLQLVGRPEVDHFQTLVTGALYGSIGVCVFVASFKEEISKDAVLVGALGAFGTVVLELIYLPKWTFFSAKPFISSLWVDLPFEIFLTIVLSRFLFQKGGFGRLDLLRNKSLKAVLFPSLLFSALISLAALFVAVKFSIHK